MRYAPFLVAVWCAAAAGWAQVPCDPVDLVKKIARVPKQGSQPTTPVVLKKVTIKRR